MRIEVERKTGNVRIWIRDSNSCEEMDVKAFVDFVARALLKIAKSHRA